MLYCLVSIEKWKEKTLEFCKARLLRFSALLLFYLWTLDYGGELNSGRSELKKILHVMPVRLPGGLEDEYFRYIQFYI